jgi:hypothetical protein
MKVICAWLLGLCALHGAQAAVERVDLGAREAVLNGRAFGASGAYEKLSGDVVFAIDPANEHNRRITDLALAPRSVGAPVVARANFVVLRPADASKGNGVALVEVSNRGGKALLPYFNAARFASDPSAQDDFGDALLLRLGYTIVWVGWQADVPDDPKLLRLQAPVARENDQAITGLVRSDWVVDQTQTVLPLAHRNHRPYPVAAIDDAANVLTEREGREAPRKIIARAAWRFTDASGRVQADRAPLTHIVLDGDFRSGKIYELVYRARDPWIVGLGFAAIRDIAAYAKYDKDALFPAKHAIAFGVSQSGRFLRHFLYQDFNTDERGRPVYDGMFVHAAGAGRGSFNHRFAQASRDAHRYNTFFYPTDLFPFSGATQRDPATGDEAGLLTRTKHPPKIFYTNSGYEYWGRAASLIHTTPDGSKDVEPLPNERIYHLASGQHFVINPPLELQSPPPSQRAQSEVYHGNPLDYLVNLRALLPRLTVWVKEGNAPPASRYPRIADATLVPVTKLKFPAVPGLPAPRVAHTAYRADYGPRWREGFIDIEPPKLDAPFVTLVPQVDEFGNELGGLRNVELLVPLGTYAPWNLRGSALANSGELTDFYGTFAPLPRDDSARDRGGDSRPAFESLYADRVVFAQRLEVAAKALVEEGFLLQEDVRRVVTRNARIQQFFGGGE